MADGAGHGEVAEAAAPLDHVRDRLAVDRDLGRDLQKIAVLLEAEDLADGSVAVGKGVGDAQAVGIGGLRVVCPVDLGGGLLVGEVEREREFQARRGVHQVERLAVVALVFLEHASSAPWRPGC